MSDEKRKPHSIVDCLLIGATKAGTESIYSYFLRHQPQIALHDKQDHYFSRGVFGTNYRGLEKEILSLEDYRNRVVITEQTNLLADFDCLILHGPEAPEMIAEANPDAKIMMILRNPIERAYSHYWMDIRECLEQRAFRQAIIEDHVKFSSGSAEYCPLVRLGYYKSHIERFQRVFSPSQIRIWLYDDLHKDFEKVLREMCEFMGVSFAPFEISKEEWENVAAVPRSKVSAVLLRARMGLLRRPRDAYLRLPRRFRRYVKRTFFIKRIEPPPMASTARRFLIEIYKKEILGLQGLLGCDLSHWMRDPAAPHAIPVEFHAQQKAKQAAFFDSALDREFEIERPHGTGALYGWSIQSKFALASKMLGFPLSGTSLLDVCCGSGMGSEFYAKAGARVTGLDISEQSVNRARERARRHGFTAEFLTGDAENLPFPDQSFDVVAVHDGLHHLPNPHAAIAEMARVARSAVIVIEPARSWLTQQAVRVGFALDFEEAGNVVYRFEGSEVVDVLKNSGFESCGARQYLLYYRHEPFQWARWVEKTPILYAIKAVFQVASFLTPNLGNKLCVVGRRTGAK
jgi:ubiquinone/menaquinone biosynthesis C-methylase UbiE